MEEEVKEKVKEDEVEEEVKEEVEEEEEVLEEEEEEEVLEVRYTNLKRILGVLEVVVVLEYKNLVHLVLQESVYRW